MIRLILTILAVLGFLSAAQAADPAALKTEAATVSARIKADADRLNAIVNELVGLIPPPVVDPPPPPPPPAQVTINAQPLNLGALIVPEFFYPMCFDRYTRTPTQPILNGPTWRSSMFGPNVDAMAICSVNQAAGGSPAAWGYPTFALEVGGKEIARGNPVEGRNYLQLNKVPTPDLPDGWYLVKVVAYDAAGNRVDLGARNPDYWVVVDKGGTAKNLDYFIVQSGNYDYVREGGPTHFWARVPKSAVVAQPKPVPPRTIVPFSTALTKDKIWRDNLASFRIGNIYRPTVTKEGITVALNRQGYFINDNYERFPPLPRLDGQRNVATIYMATDIKIGRHHQGYILDSCALSRVDLDGHKKTLAGCRHTQPTYYGDAKNGTNVEWVGDWSAVIAAGGVVGWRDAWGFDWVKSTLAVNENAPLIGDEHPHGTGPEALVADAMNNRLLKLTFAPDSREVPPKVTICATGLSDPWDVVIANDDTAYVSERTGDRIARFNARTCERLPDFVRNDTTIKTTLDSLRRAVASSGTLEQRRAAKVLGPEGIAFSADGKRLYVGSTVEQAISGYDLVTGEKTLIAEPDYSASAKSYFTKIFVSDGTFGPADAVGATTWSETQFGRPQIWLPEIDPKTGKRKLWDFHGYSALAYGSPGTMAQIYAAACGIGNGVMMCSTADEGLALYSQRLATDVAPSITEFQTGKSRYDGKGYRLLWGEYGFGHLNIPLPCNDNDVLPFLKANGHCQ